MTNINNRIQNPIESHLILWDPNNASNKWPATMFAARRTERVIGRMIFLTVSITTITGIKPEGVPNGTKWAIIVLNWFKLPQINLPSQRGRAKPNVKIKWLELVKI